MGGYYKIITPLLNMNIRYWIPLIVKMSQGIMLTKLLRLFLMAIEGTLLSFAIIYSLD